MIPISTRVALVTVSKIPTKLSVRFKVAPGLVSKAGGVEVLLLPSVLSSLLAVLALLLLLPVPLLLLLPVLLLVVVPMLVPMVAAHS